MTESFIPPHGGYQKLLSYQKAMAESQTRPRGTPEEVAKVARSHTGRYLRKML